MSDLVYQHLGDPARKSLVVLHPVNLQNKVQLWRKKRGQMERGEKREKEKREGEGRQRGEVPVDRMNRFSSFFECSKREGS